jgi:hypothetical protein
VLIHYIMHGLIKYLEKTMDATHTRAKLLLLPPAAAREEEVAAAFSRFRSSRD